MILDIENYKELFDQYYQGLCFFATRYLPDTEDPEDVVQDVFITIWEKRKSFSDIKNIKSFLFASVRNSCLNIIKRNKLKNNYEVYAKNAAEIDLESQIIEEEVYIKLYNEIIKLPTSCKKVMLLTFEGLKNREIAEKLNISTNTVKTQKVLGVSKLKSKMEEFQEYLTIFF